MYIVHRLKPWHEAWTNNILHDPWANNGLFLMTKSTDDIFMFLKETIQRNGKSDWLNYWNEQDSKRNKGPTQRIFGMELQTNKEGSPVNCAGNSCILVYNKIHFLFIDAWNMVNKGNNLCDEEMYSVVKRAENTCSLSVCYALIEEVIIIIWI